MSGSVNKVVLIGRLVRDPEIRASQNGKSIVSFTIATSETWKDKSGERKEKSEFHRVVIFNEGLAKVAEQYLKKGTTVYLEGQLQTRKWTNKDGVEQYSTEVVLQNYRGELVMLGGKSAGDDERPAALKQSITPRAMAAQAPIRHGVGSQIRDLDDEIPFSAEFR